VALHAVAPPVEQQRPVSAVADREVDGLVRARVERDLGGLVALADDPQRRLVAGAAEITDVWAARLGDAQAVESEQADQRVGVSALGFGGGQQVS
jgi:hypothetical protein